MPFRVLFWQPEEKLPLLDCTHEGFGDAKQACPHLLEQPGTDYYKVFTGSGRTYFLACAACNKKEEQVAAIPLKTVCDACFAHIEADGCWEGDRGTPEIREESANLRFVSRRISPLENAPGEETASLRRVCPLPGVPGNSWVGMTAAGALVEMNCEASPESDGSSSAASNARTITTLTPDDVDTTQTLSLVCSPDGRFLCVTETLGSKGVVIDRVSGHCTFRWKRDDYHADVSPFPTAFVTHESRTLLVHGTAWNRLDVSDPATGELLTERSPKSYEGEQPRPPHYLDYFHGSLLASPDYGLIADDGWIWHPVGSVRVWSVRRWLSENVWESEDGLSVKELTWRYYFWGGPMCWIDNRTLAVWGHGDDNDRILPAVRLFDATAGVERDWFPGPDVSAMGKMVGFESLADPRQSLFFDRYLFAVSERNGIAIWNVESGARLHQDATFSPIAYHPTAKEFLTLLPDGGIQLSRLVGDGSPSLLSPPSFRLGRGQEGGRRPVSGKNQSLPYASSLSFGFTARFRRSR